MSQLLEWVRENLGLSFTAAAVVSAVIGFFARNVASWVLERRKESRATRADQKRAAIEFAHIMDEYRSYWIAKHFDDESAPPVENHWVQWGGDRFDPLITAEHRALHARLSPTLQSEAFDLQKLVREKKELISQISEYRDDDLDFEGPIAVCEIALATDKLYRHVMQEAGLNAADHGYAFDSIRRRLKQAEKDKAEAEAAKKKAMDNLRRHVEERKATPD